MKRPHVKKMHVPWSKTRCLHCEATATAHLTYEHNEKEGGSISLTQKRAHAFTGDSPNTQPPPEADHSITPHNVASPPRRAGSIIAPVLCASSAHIFVPPPLLPTLTKGVFTTRETHLAKNINQNTGRELQYLSNTKRRPKVQVWPHTAVYPGCPQEFCKIRKTHIVWGNVTEA